MILNLTMENQKDSNLAIENSNLKIQIPDLKTAVSNQEILNQEQATETLNQEKTDPEQGDRDFKSRDDKPRDYKP